MKAERLDADKIKKVIDRFVYAGKPSLPAPDIIEVIHRQLKLADRAPTRQRVLNKVIAYVETFVNRVGYLEEL